MNGKQRIAEQSRVWLWEAFISLLQEKGYESITISQIADQAQLSRRTFYRSFKSKEALVDYYCNHQIDRYFDLLKTQPALSIQQILVLFFNSWLAQRDTLRLLIKNNLFDRLLNKWTNRSPAIYDIFKAPWHIQGSPEEIEYIMAFSTAGFWHVLQIWLMKENPESPEMLTSTFLKAFNKMTIDLKD